MLSCPATGTTSISVMAGARISGVVNNGFRRSNQARMNMEVFYENIWLI
jgi:hypothetical protein